MKRSISPVLLLAFALAACTAPEADPGEETTSTEAELEGKADTQWHKMLSCDSGAAVLDVNSGERRDLQLVIRDRGVIGYLANQVRVSTQGILSPSGEIIVRGHQDWGVFQPGDFQSMEGGVPYVSVNVHREWSGLKVTFYQTINWSRCAGGEEPSPSTGTCSGESVSGSTYNELANWFFRDCR